MKRFILFIACAALFLTALSPIIVSQAYPEDISGEFPQKNAWTQAIPSVVWNGDPASVTTLTVHIVKRKDVKRVWLTSLGGEAPEGRRELFDDGTHGDVKANDRVFTLADVALPGRSGRDDMDPGFHTWWGFLRVELADGTLLGNDYGMIVGMADPEYKNQFPVRRFGNGLSATPWAFFIEDSGYQVMDSYPVANVYCGTKNYQAYKKLYSVYPDVFDFALLTPGMQIFRPKDLAENVPYNVQVSNAVKNIGIRVFDNTGKFGSAGRLKSVQFESFSCYEIADHETGHNWAAYIGKRLGLLEKNNYAHWNSLSDIGGQMGYFYFEGDRIGRFKFNGDGTWHLTPNTAVEPYSPLELYVMGLVPSSEIPDIHVLKNPDFTNPERITAETYQTISAKQLEKAMGGERIPSAEDSQKDFTMAVLVTQDLPFNDAAYAFFSLYSQELGRKSAPRMHDYFAPFFWATGGRATLNTFLGDYVTIKPAE